MRVLTRSGGASLSKCQGALVLPLFLIREGSIGAVRVVMQAVMADHCERLREEGNTVESGRKEEAKSRYEEYMEAGLKLFPPFKGYGVKLIQFAIDEPELYRIHFTGQNDMSTTDYLKEKMEMDKILPFISSSLELNEQDAKWLFTNMAFYALGMGSLLADSSCIMSDAEINRNLGSVCRGLMMQLKAAKDERVEVIPDENVKDMGKLEEYVRGKKNLIIGYSTDREMFQIRLDAVLYFEAVGEKVFAYTKQHVYEIRQRLY